MDSIPVAVIGAGPYGLAMAAHLRSSGLDPHVFGDPMGFWSKQMPDGMLLRSGWDGSHISDPARVLTLDHYEAELGRRLQRPIPISDFIGYGNWFADQVAPSVDRRCVTELQKTSSQFRLLLSDGDTLPAQRVVVATGISEFARMPCAFSDMPASAVSHASAHRTFATFAGKDVMVVGGGQSALESAALLHEAGARVEVVVRGDRVNWLTHGAGSRLNTVLASRRNPLRPLLFPPSEIGPIGISLVVDKPWLYAHLPTSAMRARVSARALRPAGAQWLRSRLDGVALHTQTTVTRCRLRGDVLDVTLCDGRSRTLDHLLLATGFQVDVARLPFLSSAIRAALRTEDGYPVLSNTLESSVAGLHFVGAPAARTVGPLVRFVAGTGYAARAVTRGASGAE